MLIVCPNCATSYTIEPASLGPAGRTVRCARCKSTWFAGGPQSNTALAAGGNVDIAAEPNEDSFVDGVTAEAATAGSGPPQNFAARDASGEDFGAETGAMPPAANEPPSPQAAEPRASRAESLAAVRAGENDLPGMIAPSLVPPIEQETAEPVAGPREIEDAEDFTARRIQMKSRRKKARRSSRWTAVLLVMFAFNVALIGARNEIVRYLPQTASLFSAIGLPVNLRHLDFTNVRIAREKVDGATILVVEGSIVSTARKPVEVPRLRFAARNKAGQEVYTWTLQPDRKILQPGERLDFQSRLASPPNDAHDVLVRFFTANDAMAGGK